MVTKARRACIDAVLERDRVCQWPPLEARYLAEHPEDEPLFARLPRCGGPLTAHEPKGAVNVGRDNPDEAIASCWNHNSAAETHTHLALKIGFVVRGAGAPIRK